MNKFCGIDLDQEISLSEEEIEALKAQIQRGEELNNNVL